MKPSNPFNNYDGQNYNDYTFEPGKKCFYIHLSNGHHNAASVIGFFDNKDIAKQHFINAVNDFGDGTKTWLNDPCYKLEINEITPNQFFRFGWAINDTL